MPTDDAALSDLHREILEFERDWVAYAGAKDEEVRARFALSPTDYHRLLSRIIDLPEAEAHAPRIVRRLRRRRTSRQEERAVRRQGGAA